MAAPHEKTPTVYEDEQEMFNGTNGGNSSQGQIVPILLTIVEEQGGFELAPMMVDVILVAPVQPVQLFDGQCLVVHAPWYHQHASEVAGGPIVNQEAKERIVVMADLLDRFGRCIEAKKKSYGLAQSE